MIVHLDSQLAVLEGLANMSSWALKLGFCPLCTYIQIEDMYMWNQVI
jgi:hypothetical protein